MHELEAIANVKELNPIESGAGAPEELIAEIEKTIMGFRLEDFDREELRQCALAVFEVCRSFRSRSSP